MTTDQKIRDEKLHHDINGEAIKISALLSRNINKYEYLTGEEILPANQRKIIEQAKFTYSPSGKTFKKLTKSMEDQEEKKQAIEDHWNQLVEYNKFIKKILISTETLYHLRSKKYLMSLSKKDILNLRI